MPNPETENLLVCALEGALLKTSLRSERVIQSTKSTLERLLSSKLDLKRLQLERTEKEATSFSVPVNDDVLKFLADEKKAGRRLALHTSEPLETVNEILSGNNIFDEIITADGSDNRLPENYDYIGVKSTSQSIWDNAAKCYLVGKAPFQGFAGHFKTPGANPKTIIKAIRAYQWLKNLLVFVPVITSQQISDGNALRNTLIMFFCFSAVASFGYIVNDLLDLQSDRAHPTKKHRPFASGALSASQGAVIAAVLMVLAMIGCLFLPPICSWVLLAYFVLTISYSLYLKTKLMIDVVSLGGLFTLRVIGGAAAIQTELSFYLLSFSIFLFSSLAMVKRYAELHNLRAQNRLAARGRGYRVEDMAPVRIIGISLGYMSVFIMGLYINSPLITQYYSNPKMIWLMLPLLIYWLGRLWILANRGEVNEDPLIFAIKDRTSLVVLIVSAAMLIAAN